MTMIRYEETDWGESLPVELLRVYSLELATLLPPGAPACVLETNSVCVIVLVTRHVAPCMPDVGFLPSAFTEITSKMSKTTQAQ